MPAWAQLLVKSMQFVVKEMKCVQDLAKRVNVLEASEVVNERVTQELQQENKRLRERLDKLELAVDDQEQRNRNNCLMLHGILETDNENTDDIVLKVMSENLGLAIPIEHIQRSHRVGPRINTRVTRQNQTRPRPIIFRFRDYRSRQSVFRTKRKLKGAGISITENLTKKRMDLYKLASARFGQGQVWTIEGRVTTKINNKITVISSEADLE